MGSARPSRVITDAALNRLHLSCKIIVCRDIESSIRPRCLVLFVCSAQTALSQVTKGA